LSLVVELAEKAVQVVTLAVVAAQAECWF